MWDTHGPQTIIIYFDLVDFSIKEIQIRDY